MGSYRTWVCAITGLALVASSSEQPLAIRENDLRRGPVHEAEAEFAKQHNVKRFVQY